MKFSIEKQHSSSTNQLLAQLQVQPTWCTLRFLFQESKRNKGSPQFG